MNLAKRTCALILVFALITGSLASGIDTVAAAVSGPKTTVLQNDFIKITVDNATGRFGIRTVEGQPIRKNDQNVDMLFRGDDPETSFTTFRIDGTDYIFGNPYKFGVNLFSETTPPQIVENPNGTKQIETIWSIKGVQIKQILMLYADASDKLNAGNVNIRYEVANRGNADVQLGTRILLDTMVGGNDGPQFQIGTTYRSPLMVERKLVHDPAAIGIPEEDEAFYKLPPYWVMRDTFNLNDPGATNVIAYGFNNFAEQNINIVDEMIVGHWNGLANTKWDYEPNPNLDFTRDTNDYGTADSAVAFYWHPERLTVGRTQSFETVYGLGEIIEPDKVFSIRYMDTVQQLATLEDNSAYANEGVFTIIAEVENLAMFNMEHRRVDLKMELESGLNFVRLDEQGRIVRDAEGKVEIEAVRSKTVSRQKPLTPEEAANGEVSSYKPGDTFTVEFVVQATGRPWPTTRQYLLTAGSEETEREIEGIEDEGIRAQYQSAKSNFILLPPIGEAVPTYVYGLSPGELFVSDIKYITLNMSNIEAYHTGDETTPPNFDLFIREKLTGKRYKVPVQQSVLMQPTDDGFSGDMRITYRGGDLVDAGGNVLQAGLGPELPLGEYQVELDYKGDAGGDEEIAAMYDITTSQSFRVTDNEASRVREANLLALYKESVDLSGLASGGTMNQELADTLNSLFPGGQYKQGDSLYAQILSFREAKTYLGMMNKAIDPDFDLGEFLDEESLSEVPLYQYRLFASQDEMDEFFDEDILEDEGIERELLVSIRGMIKEAGTGDDKQVIVDTETEPAIINDAVAYKGKDIVFVRGDLDIFGMKNSNPQFANLPFFQTLFVRGEGTLSVASSGFVFHKGQWTLDFFNGFNKTLGEGYVLKRGEIPESKDNEEDDSLNGSLRWAVGSLGDRINPLRQVMLETVYFNRHSLFAPPSFTISGFGFTFNDFILREGGISFGGSLSLKVLEAEAQNVIFNSKGFVGVEASLGFDLNQDLGLFSPSDDKKKKDGDDDAPKGKITVIHYVQPVGVNNQYGIEFEAKLKSIGVSVELAFKKVDDGRILPDVIGFGAEFDDGILLTGATYLTGIRGAVRELADTIAGGTKNDPFPLTVEAGVSVKFGVQPAFFHGDIDLTVKRTGIKIEGKMDFSVKQNPSSSDLLPMVTHALLEAQWITPWFVRFEAEVDIGGWDIIVGRAGIFVGQNLEKNRIDFEGYIGAKVQVPSGVPIVGGMPLASVFFGVNNDKIWGSVSILLITLGVTYYWGGGLEFGTSGEDLPEGLIHLLVEDPEQGPKLIVIGQGVETVATSWIDAEKDEHGVIYREVAEGVQIIENGATSLGVGGIAVKNNGRTHEIPMAAVAGNAIIEVEYDGKIMPSIVLRDGAGKQYPLIFDNTNTLANANAFTQFIPAAQSPDKVDVRKAYIIVPNNKASGTWTLTSGSPVETRLLNVPTTPELIDVNLTKQVNDPNQFTASWKVANANPGDIVNLYLTEDALTTETSKLENGEDVLEPGDPGVLIARDLAVDRNGGVSGNITSGSTVIDVTKVSLLGDVEDIRGLLGQGKYYLRAELSTPVAYGTKTSSEQFEIVDPLAPRDVTEVVIEPAGNGLFSLSFKPGEVKAGQEGFEHSYAIEALQEADGELATYPNFGEVLFTAEELAPYWNEASGRYEGILLGGWTAMSTTDEVNTESLDGMIIDRSRIKYFGLEAGKEYVLGVSAVTLPDKQADKNQNYHYANRVDSAKRLLPIPAKPKLNAASGSAVKALPHYMELLTNATEQRIELTSNQQDIEVEALYGEQSLGVASFVNNASGSSGSIALDQFATDGPYAIELVARNTRTNDVSVTMLYLTVDTIAPVLYIDEPVTGTRSTASAGANTVAVRGTTSNDVPELLVNGQAVAVAEDGSFDGMVTVSSGEPTEELVFVARDKAGNENTAIVEITNAAFEAPSAIVIEQVPALQPGESFALSAKLKIAKGKNDEGKPIFEEVPIKPEDLGRLSYRVAIGDSIGLTESGRVTALATGASLIEAEYRISDNVTVTGMVAASVEVPDPGALQPLTASTEAVSGNTGQTKLNVALPPDTTGLQLVYKVFPGGTGAEVPAYNEDLSGWSFVPADGLIPAMASDVVVTALRTSLDKKAWYASAKLAARVWQPTGGGTAPGDGFPGGGFPGGVIPEPEEEQEQPSESARLTVNGNEVEPQWRGTTLVVHVTEQDADGEDAEELAIAVQSGATIRGFDVTVDEKLVAQALDKGQRISLDLQGNKLLITPGMLQGHQGHLRIGLAANSDSARTKLDSIARSIGAEALGGGAGYELDTNLPVGAWSQYGSLRLAVPTTLNAGDVTAVVLMDADGNWTTVPWSLEQSGGAAYANIRITGEGNLMFVRNTASFGDVASTHWSAGAIADASGRLFMLGKSTDRFDPNGNVTRAEYPTVLLRVAGLMNMISRARFTDIDEAQWYYRSVSIAAELGIVTGRGDGSYAPGATLTRLEAMAMTGRLLESLSIGEELSAAEIDELLAGFADGTSIPDWARAAVAGAIRAGIILGDNGYINPYGNLSRAQAASIAVRLNTLIVE